MWLVWASAAWALPGAGTPWAVVQEAGPRVECAVVGGEPWCRAIGAIDQPIDRVAVVLEDMPRYKDRFPRILDMRMLDDDTLYVLLDYPAGLSDRDYVARYTRSTDAQARLWRWEPATHPDAPPGAAVRLPQMAGEWRLDPIDPGHTRVTYTWQADLGGSFPNFLAARARAIAGTAALTDLTAATR